MESPIALNPAGTGNVKPLRQQVAEANSLLLRDGVAADGDARHASLVKAANTFEASMMQELMKPLNAKDPLFAEQGASDDDADGGVLTSFGSEALAQALASQGGLGIGRMVVKQLEKDSSRNETGPTKVSKKNLQRD